MDLSKMDSLKIKQLQEQLNLTQEEQIVFDMLSRGKSITEIASRIHTSKRTVDNRILKIKNKMEGLEMSNAEKYQVPIWEKCCLTINEAAAYSNIGIHKLEEMSAKPNCPFVLYAGERKRLIKRVAFEKYLNDSLEI